jgi:hypothetical protein
MGKASSTKKVARAAGTGGGRTARGSRPYGWYSILTVFVLVGVALIVFSRHEQQQLASFHPKGADHWHAAYAIDICGTIEPNLPQNPNLTNGIGIHTHGDGLIHVEPYVSGLSADAGNNATLARFASTYPSFKLTSTEIQYPGQALHKNGQKCGNKAAQVRIRVWPSAGGSTSITYSDPKDVHLKDQEAMTIAFLPSGDDIPKPPQANIDQLKNPSAQEPGNTATTIPGATATTVPGQTTLPPTTTPGATAATTPAATTPAATGSPPTSAK